MITQAKNRYYKETLTEFMTSPNKFWRHRSKKNDESLIIVDNILFTDPAKIASYEFFQSQLPSV